MMLITTSLKIPQLSKNGLRVGAPGYTPCVYLSKVRQGLSRAFASESVQPPEQQNVKMLLARSELHALELHSILSPTAADGVTVFSDYLPLPKARLFTKGDIVSDDLTASPPQAGRRRINCSQLVRRRQYRLLGLRDHKVEQQFFRLGPARWALVPPRAYCAWGHG